MKYMNIEKEDIPHVYYYGLISNLYPVIAMSLFDGSLNDLYERCKGDISDLQILEIFKQAVSIVLNFSKIVTNHFEYFDCKFRSMD